MILVAAGDENHRVMAAVCPMACYNPCLQGTARNGVIGNKGGPTVSGAVQTETDGHRLVVSSIAVVGCVSGFASCANIQVIHLTCAALVATLVAT